MLGYWTSYMGIDEVNTMKVICEDVYVMVYILYVS